MSLQGLPASKITAVNAALLQAFGTTTLDDISQLAGGLSSALVYKIIVNARPYVLRVMLHTNALSDPARLFPITQLAADAEITPRLYYADVDNAISITDFVESKPLMRSYAEPYDLLRDLAHMVKRIHDLPPFPALVNFMDGVDGFIELFQTSGRLPAYATAEHFEHYAQIQQVYPRHAMDLVSSHNDLNYGNILYDGKRLWIIDWEAAFLNDRYVDLANLANGFVNTPDEEDLFLRAYFGEKADTTQWARYVLMRPVCHFYYAMIMLNMLDARVPKGVTFDPNMETPTYAEFRQQIGAGTVQLATDAGQLLFAKVALNEALRQMQSASFEQALAQIRQPA